MPESSLPPVGAGFKPAPTGWTGSSFSEPLPGPLRFVLVRHATPETTGSDPGLSVRGREEAEALAQRLRNWRFDAAWSSELRRAGETAEILTGVAGSRGLLKSALLNEVDSPWEGYPAAEVGAYSAWERDALGKMAANLSRWLATATREVRDRGVSGEANLLVVSHAGPLRVLICLLLGLSPESHWCFHLDRAGVSLVERGDDMGTLMLLNDGCHLGGLAG